MLDRKQRDALRGVQAVASVVLAQEFPASGTREALTKAMGQCEPLLQAIESAVAAGVPPRAAFEAAFGREHTDATRERWREFVADFEQAEAQKQADAQTASSAPPSAEGADTCSARVIYLPERMPDVTDHAGAEATGSRVIYLPERLPDVAEPAAAVDTHAEPATASTAGLPDSPEPVAAAGAGDADDADRHVVDEVVAAAGLHLTDNVRAALVRMVGRVRARRDPLPQRPALSRQWASNAGYRQRARQARARAPRRAAHRAAVALARDGPSAGEVPPPGRRRRTHTAPAAVSSEGDDEPPVQGRVSPWRGCALCDRTCRLRAARVVGGVVDEVNEARGLVLDSRRLCTVNARERSRTPSALHGARDACRLRDLDHASPLALDAEAARSPISLTRSTPRRGRPSIVLEPVRGGRRRPTTVTSAKRPRTREVRR